MSKRRKRHSRGLACLLYGCMSVLAAGGPLFAQSESRGKPAILRATLDPAVARYRASLKKEPPALRGFRAPILDRAAEFPPIAMPSRTGSPKLWQVADRVAGRLARVGLLPTLADAIEQLGPSSIPPSDEEAIRLLRAIGLPTDLLGFFSPPGDPASGPCAIVRYIAGRLKAGRSARSLRGELDAVPFRFKRSRPDFEAAAEGGEHDLALLRLQLPRGNYWKGAGDGSAVDIARQLIAGLPDVDFIASLSAGELDAFLASSRDWPLGQTRRLQLLVEPLPVAQWAQDNGRPGFVGAAGTASRRPATLVPRYASVGEEYTKFAPGESFLVDTLAATGHAVIQSPLIFQGGNIIPLRDPATGERVLLIGEAEVYRNTALGLSRDQVLEAMRIEFAVDRCVVLPAAAFHIDFELSARVIRGRLVCFVNDTPAAVRIILSLGIDALEQSGTLSAEAARGAREALKTGRDGDVLQRVGGAVAKQIDARRRYPASLAKFFGRGETDAPIANFQRFLLALDILASTVVKPEDMPGDRNLRAFAGALRRQAADRAALQAALRRLGWRTVGVPSLSSADRGINYLNGIHDRRHYILPVYGGFYEPLDRAAAAAFRAELGPDVRILPVLSGESQRELGAVHCSVAAYPKP
ncbi:MAG: hypothetical protein ACE5E1_08970 [Phycisphaerae bacterium]